MIYYRLLCYQIEIVGGKIDEQIYYPFIQLKFNLLSP